MSPSANICLRAVAVPLAGAALLALVAWQNHRLTTIRRTGLPDAPDYATQAPPVLNFLAVGLGGFRGVAAEILWARVDRLQMEGRYLELVQLSDWITGLDPHATEAWSYSAWNMAYNISAMMRRPEDRVRWVAHGIALLRDRGIPANPHNARLYRDLAWFFQHKIGGDDDSAHLAYKLVLATGMAPCVQPDGGVAVTPENRHVLDDYRLDPVRMRQLERRFGPLDWRVAGSHAVYWASLGLEHARGHDVLACRRAIYQPLLVLCTQAGRFDGDLVQGTYHAVPNPALIPATLQLLAATFRDDPVSGVRVAYARFLAIAIQQAQRDGRSAQAQAWYQDLLRAGQNAWQQPSFDDVLQGRLDQIR